MTASIVLNPTNGHVGDTVTITGTGFTGSDVVTFTFGGAAISTIPSTVTEVSGAFSCTFVVPAGQTFSVEGSHNVVATDTGSATATAAFIINPKVVLSATSGIVGYSDTITLSGFAATSAVTATFGATSIVLASSTTDAHGALTTTYTVPAATADSVEGNHTVTATDAATNTANATFSITPAISVSPTYGDKDTTGITLTATGFAATSACTATFEGLTITLSSSTTDAHGALSATFNVPSPVTDGSQTVELEDHSSNTATTTFLISAAGVALDPTFSHLNGRNFHIKNTVPCREREAIVNVTFGASDEYVTGGMPVDFSTIEHFIQVYIAEVIQSNYGLAISFIPASGNISSDGVFKFYGSSGSELLAGSTAIQNVTLKCRIRGI